MAALLRINRKVVALVTMSALGILILWRKNGTSVKLNPNLSAIDELQHQPSEKLPSSAFKPQAVEKPPPPDFKLLPEDRYLPYFSYDGLSMFQSSQCTCDPQNGLSILNFQTAFTPEELPSVKKRRQKEFEHYKKRYKSIPQDVLIAKPNSPLSYPVYGVEVRPVSTIRLPGLGVHTQDGPLHEVTLEASQGTFNTLADVPDSVYHGRGTKKVNITSSNMELVNFILQHTTYTSTVYHIHAVDTVTFKMGPHSAQFPVVIRQVSVPILYDPGEEQSLNSLVTIATKTFLRYDNLRLLIKSIRTYYPNITIIVADDSDVPEKIQDPNVEQYFMPFAKGWFAGRNLAISQVTTKYFLWVDDDFIFTKNGLIEKLLNVLENTNLDMVAGNVDSNIFSFKLLYQEGGDDGDCLHWRHGSYMPVEGFPDCGVTSGVVNFFLAHTTRLQRVGFDPKLARVAHSEFFIDGLGSLLAGSCPKIVIGHQRHNNAPDPVHRDQMKKYNSFRISTHDEVAFKLRLHYFKNRLKCYSKK